MVAINNFNRLARRGSQNMPITVELGIMNYIRMIGEPLSSKEISEALGKEYSTTRSLVFKMVAEGQLIQPKEGIYYINNINT
jgi:DNA-binding IclR family transcriptional regulator